MTRPLVIAHRGASAVELENSVAAFRAAVRLGADGVELDLHASVDGELFVHHDETVNGVHHIPRTAATKIRGVRLRNGDPVPTLADALAACGALRVYIEIKSLAPQFDERLLDVLDAGPNPPGYAVHAFDHRIVRRLRERRSTLATGVLAVSYLLRPAAALTDAGAGVLWQEQRLVDRDLVEAVHGAGGEVIAWTVDAPSRMRRLAELGVDGICTNRPDLARTTLMAA